MNRNKYLIFNINSGEITGAVVFFDEEKEKTVIEYSFKSKIKIDQNDALINFSKYTKNSLRSVCENISQYIKISKGIDDIKESFIFLTSPWIKKDIKVLKDEQIKPFKITQNYLNRISKSFEKKNNELMKSEIISVKANDYNIFLTDAFNKKVLKFTSSSINSYISFENKTFFENDIKEFFPSIKTSYLPFLPTFFNQIVRKYDISGDFMFLDFTGELMEFGIYQDNDIKNIITIETGKNKIIRSLVVNKIAKSISDAEYIFSLYLRKELEKEISQEIKKIIKVHTKHIKEEIDRELKNYKKFQVPKKVFVVTNGEINTLVKDINIFENIEFIKKSTLKEFVDSNDEKYFNNFIALEAEYIFG